MSIFISVGAEMSMACVCCWNVGKVLRALGKAGKSEGGTKDDDCVG